MPRLNQLNPLNYPSQAQIHAEFQQLIAFLQTTERGTKTLNDLLTMIFTAAGAIKSDLIEFQWDTVANQLQYRVAGGAWTNTGATLATLQGAPGVSGNGTGDMVRSVYDPNNDGLIAYPQLGLADDVVPQAKINGLTAALLTRAVVVLSATAPASPTYPPNGPFTIWIDSSTSPQTLKWWDGVSQWRDFATASTASATGGVIEVLAGEALSNRDLVFMALAEDYGANVATGGTALASAGTAANAFDGTIGTECDTASATGWVGYQFATARAIGMIEVLFAASSRNHAFIMEVSPDGTAWSSVGTVAVQSYDGNHRSFFRIDTPLSQTRFRLRATAGSSNLVVREMLAYERVIERGRAYKVNDTANNPVRVSPALAIITAAGNVGTRVSARTPGTVLDGFSALSSGALYYTGATPGLLSLTPGPCSIFVGEARSATQLNFAAQPVDRRIGEVTMFTGPITSLPPGYRLCDGSIMSRVAYPELFAKIGSIYGANDGQTSFYLPDLRDRFVIGARQDNAGVPNTNITGALTQSGGSTSIIAGGGGASLAGATAAGQVVPPYYTLAFAIRVF